MTTAGPSIRQLTRSGGLVERGPILSERPSVAQWAGTFVMLLAIFYVGRTPQKDKSAPTTEHQMKESAQTKN